MTHLLSQRIADVMAIAPTSRALHYEGHWFSWADLYSFSEHLSATVIRHSNAPHPCVGIIVRNTPIHVCALLAVLKAGATAVLINPSRGDTRSRADATNMRLPMVIGTANDVKHLVETSPCTTVVTLESLTTTPHIESVAELTDTQPDRPGVAVWMLTSGTTGPPKRVDLTYDMLARSVMGPDPATAPSPTNVRRGVAIVNSPLGHVGGVFRVLLCIAEARPFVLLPRFEIETWAAAVREHRPRAVSLVPAAVRMVLHSELTRDDLAGVEVVTSGTAALSADDADAFTTKFGIPVLTSYAATEFGGGVAAWTLTDHRKYWRSKRGSVGRALKNSQLRVVADDGTPLGPDERGLLEVKPAQHGPAAQWLRTTDLARIDADGFLWILGRSDQAIIRGGFKVMPDDVREALESHPAVEGAAVVGYPDTRLGEVPIALVELRPGATANAKGLSHYLRSQLARYEIPTQITFVEHIPRTPSGKPDLNAVKEHLHP